MGTSLYLTALEENDFYSPNFWCSEEYWEKAGWKERMYEDALYVIDEKGDRMLPTFEDMGTGKYECLHFVHPYWAGFSEFLEKVPDISIAGEHQKFLDYEIIYDPKNFLRLEGKKWKLFRKNLKRFEKEVKESSGIQTICDEVKIDKFVDDWTMENAGKTFYDPEIILKYLLQGKNRFFIMGNKSKKLYSICAWDENWKYVNFRYCMCRSMPGLSDYSRFLFYYTMALRHPYKLVNDGGTLGSESLF